MALFNTFTGSSTGDVILDYLCWSLGVAGGVELAVVVINVAMSDPNKVSVETIECGYWGDEAGAMRLWKVVTVVGSGDDRRLCVTVWLCN